jgi:hypothetical protein
MADEASLPQRLAFVVQLSLPEASSGRLVGRVSHVVSARSARFTSPEECLAFIRRVLSEQDEELEGRNR